MASAAGSINATAKWTPSGGSAAEIPHVKSWEVEETADNQEYASAQTGGYKARVLGQRDQSGSVECYRDAALAALPLAEGDIGTMVLAADDAHDEKTVIAIIDSVSVNANPEDGSPIGVTISFSRYGASLPS